MDARDDGGKMLSFFFFFLSLLNLIKIVINFVSIMDGWNIQTNFELMKKNDALIIFLEY